jgi:hypothetical protein
MIVCECLCVTAPVRERKCEIWIKYVQKCGLYRVYLHKKDFDPRSSVMCCETNNLHCYSR